ncbi:MAG: LysE family transporter [Roseibium sp.]|uniref:LysE family transporter n=1 Tax=Roseibium sp. TaxID=1936156 RepID=UPI00345C4C90|nr:LysE family transporter [Roseibium sp.]
MWAILAISAIIGVSQSGPLLFDILGLVCGFYLIWLGVKTLRSQSSKTTAIVDVPGQSGLIFGYTNLKAILLLWRCLPLSSHASKKR